MAITIGKQKARINIGGADKPTFRIGKKNAAPLSPFHQLVREAIEVSEQLNATYGGKLSADAAMNEAAALAKATPAQIKKLRGALNDGTLGLDHSRAAVRRLLREIFRDGKFNTLPRDPSKLAPRLTHYCGRAPDELLPYGASLLTLFACAVAEAAERFPDAFGTADSSAALSGNVAELQARQRALFEKIQANITADALDFGEYLQGRATPAKFKNTDVEVAPVATAGERLVQYLMAHREKRT